MTDRFDLNEHEHRKCTQIHAQIQCSSLVAAIWLLSFDPNQSKLWLTKQSVRTYTHNHRSLCADHVSSVFAVEFLHANKIQMKGKKSMNEMGSCSCSHSHSIQLISCVLFFCLVQYEILYLNGSSVNCLFNAIGIHHEIKVYHHLQCGCCCLSWR